MATVTNDLRIIVREREGNDPKLEEREAEWLYSFNTALVSAKISDTAVIPWKRQWIKFNLKTSFSSMFSSLIISTPMVSSVVPFKKVLIATVVFLPHMNRHEA